MRRLTLILSDLYLPEGVTNGGVHAQAIELPELEWLMRFARRVEPIRDWRSWLIAELGVAGLSGVPVAQCCALGLLPATAASNCWLATPVHLQARLDHVRLADRGLLRPGADERRAWCEEFARAFGPEYALHDAGERTFLLSGLGASRVASVDPARLLDADIGQALPVVPAGGELRRLGTEIEMWLHGAALNTVRERARHRRISALWLWGGGAADSIAPVARPATPEVVQLFGGDAFLVALAREVGTSPGAMPRQLSPAPRSFAALESGATHCVVELTPMSGPPEESLATLEPAWFTPAREALSSGDLECVDVIANDRWFRIAARPAWRIWRRRRSWLAQLGRGVPGAKA
jgi:hypothetical protein